MNGVKKIVNRRVMGRVTILRSGVVEYHCEMNLSLPVDDNPLIAESAKRINMLVCEYREV